MTPRAEVRSPVHPALRSVVALLWYEPVTGAPGGERVVPSGGLHLAWRDVPIVCDGGPAHRYGVVGGVRETAHHHDLPDAYRSVGAVLLPGATERLFGVPAAAFAGQHVPLDALWGSAAPIIVERLFGAHPLDALEATLVSRLRPAARPPGLARAMALLEGGASLGEASRAVGRSPRTLRGWFDGAVGCNPAHWMRLRRLQRALHRALREPDWAEVARVAGYCDQAHLSREVRRIVGVTPTQWRASVRDRPNHVADPSKTDGARRVMATDTVPELP